MRIVQITKDFSITGGVARYVVDLTEALRAAGHTVAVVHADPRAEPGADALLVEGFADFDPRSKAAATTRRILEFLTRFAPDVVHVQGTDNDTLERGLLERHPTCKTMHVYAFCPTETKFHHARRAPCRHPTGPMCLPRMVIDRCTLTRRPSRMWGFYQRSRRANRTHAAYPALIVASDYVKRQAVATGYARSAVTVVPYFTTPSARPAADVEATDPVVLFAGRVVREKGLQLLLAALGRVDPPWQLAVVGDGHERPDAERLVRRLGLDARVRFHGWAGAADLDAHYRRARVVAVPSLWPEPFGIVGLEAMSHRRPVVAFDVGGIGEWLAEGVNGFLVPPYDLDRFAARLATLLGQPALARAQGDRGHAIVAERFTAAAHLERLMPIYQRLARERRPACAARG